MNPVSAMSTLYVDLDALAANYAVLRQQAGQAEVAPVVKANGYGLGAVPVAKRLRAEGAETFFVARLAEGASLREALGRSPKIMVLDGCTPSAASILIGQGLTPVLNAPDQIGAWVAAGGGEAALMLDTGLNRLGLTERQARDVAGSSAFRITEVMSHLACADEPNHPMNAKQNACFRDLAALFPCARKSLAASDGLFLGPDFAFDMVRTGICLYGGGPEGRPDPRIRAVATFEAPILQLRQIGEGQTVGYGAAFTARAPMIIAVVGAGYADGVLRAGSPKAYGSLNGRRCAVLGRISMDLTAYDVTRCEDARPGAMMQIIGSDVPVDEAAAAAGTIAYEFLTRIGARATRTYKGER